MIDHISPIVVRLSDGDKRTPYEVERSTAALFEDLSQLPDITVARSSSEIEAGAKSGAVLQSAELIVSFLSGGGMAGLVAALKVWTSRDKDRSAELHLPNGESIKISGATRDQQDRIINRALDSDASQP